MGDIVNLRQARKARACDMAQVKAQENRLHFGQSRAGRAALALEQAVARKSHAAHLRNRPAPKTPDDIES